MCHALELLLPPLVPRNLPYLVGIWNRYMDEACSNPDTIEWSNFNDCIHVLSSGPLTDFISPSRLASLAVPIVQWVSFCSFAQFCVNLSRHADLVPNIFTVFFHRPRFSYTIRGSTPEGDWKDNIRYNQVSKHNVDLLSSFCSEFMASLNVYRGFSDKILLEHHAISDSVLGTIETRQYCHLINEVLKTYANGRSSNMINRDIRAWVFDQYVFQVINPSREFWPNLFFFCVVHPSQN